MNFWAGSIQVWQGFGTFILSNCYTVYFLRSLLFVFIIRKSADMTLYCICIELSGENHDNESQKLVDLKRTSCRGI